jgi:outer membrane protein assembly factor BamB
MTTRALLAVAACLLVLSARADDWPQYRGPNRDDVSRERGLLKEWPATGPKLLWAYKDAGNGYSGPAIVGEVLYTQGARGDDEYVFALDLTGKEPKEKWAVKVGPTFVGPVKARWNRGPSATPSVANGHIYAIGGQGDLVCVDVAQGNEVWRKSFLKDLGGEVSSAGGAQDKLAWGYAGSPLVDGDNVICVPGGADGTVAALHAKTGAVVWRSKGLTESATYSSPLAAKPGGKQQYIVMLQDGAAGVDAATGNLLWRYTRSEYGDIVAPTPVVKGDLVFITAAPKGGRDLFKVTADGGIFAATKVYADRKLQNHLGGVVLVGNELYGCSGEGRTTWFCQEFQTGKILWENEEADVSTGSLTCADGKLYVLGEKTGEVGLVDASSAGWKLISHFALPERSKVRPPGGKVWAHPVVANGKLYLRDQELIFCYEVK